MREEEEKEQSTAHSRQSPHSSGPIDPAVEMGIAVPPGMRLWLDEPPGLRKPPYLPPPPAATSAPPSSTSSLPLIAPSSLSGIRPSPQLPSYGVPTAPEPPIIRIPLPPPMHSVSWQHPHRPPPPPPRAPPADQPRHSHLAHRGGRPPPRSSSHAEPPEIDPLDPNPETALDLWNRGRDRGRGALPPPAAAAAAAPPPAPPVPDKPAPRIIPRPAFVPTNLLVKNRPSSTEQAATVGRPNVSRPVSSGSGRVVVNAAPAVAGPTSATLEAGSGIVKKRTQAELEYDLLMRSLEAEGAL